MSPLLEMPTPYSEVAATSQLLPASKQPGAMTCSLAKAETFVSGLPTVRGVFDNCGTFSLACTTRPELPDMTADDDALAFFDAADEMTLGDLAGAVDLSAIPNLDDFNEFSVPSMEDFESLDDLSCAGTGGAVRRRRPKTRVPDDIRNTEKYKERRRKNNLAAARNRELKRMQQQDCVDRLPALNAHNTELRTECALLRAELLDLLTRVQTRLQEQN
eukprot:m.220620 g.220620  ORF g.220620 m.220620 type:complete len:217 (+) comp10418_c0_seq1:1794-2444(+)